MDFRLCHVGDVRQYTLDPRDVAVPSGRLHVPRIELPRDTAEKNLHGDVPGSPYSSTPGEISLQEAAERAEPKADKADRADKDQAEAKARADKDQAEAKARADKEDADTASRVRSHGGPSSATRKP